MFLQHRLTPFRRRNAEGRTRWVASSAGSRRHGDRRVRAISIPEPLTSPSWAFCFRIHGDVAEVRRSFQITGAAPLGEERHVVTQ